MSDLVGNPEDRFSHNEAQLISIFDRCLPVCCSSTVKLLKFFHLNYNSQMFIVMLTNFPKFLDTLNVAVIALKLVHSGFRIKICINKFINVDHDHTVPRGF